MQFLFVRLVLALLPATALAATSPDSLAGRKVSCADFRSGDAIEVSAQRLTPVGSIDAAWSPSASHLCVGTANEVASVRVSDGAGGAIVVWVDTRVEDGDIYAQHLTAAGNVAPGWPAGGVPICTATGAQYLPSISSDGAGGAFVAWMDFRLGARAQVFAQRVESDGTTSWAADGIPVAADSCDQVSPSVLAYGTSAALFAWTAMRGDSSELRVIKLDALGHPPDVLPTIGLGISGGQSRKAAPRLIGRPLGSWLEWLSEESGHTVVRALPLSPEGDPEANWPPEGIALSSSQATASLAAAIPDTSGGLITVWCEQNGETDIVRAQRVMADRTLAWEAGGVATCSATTGQYNPTIAADGQGGVVAVWEDYRASTEADIWAQRVTVSGERVWGANGAPVCVTAGHQFAPSVTMDAAGGALVTWVDGPSSARASYARATPIASGKVPRLISANAAPGRAVVSWRTGRGDQRRLSILRRDPDQDWHVVSSRLPDEAGVITHEDRGLRPNSSVGYRLASLEGAEPVWYDEVNLEIPSPRPLAIDAARAISGGRRLSLAFTLQSDEPASFEIFDVQGRRMESRTLETNGAGDYSLEVPLSQKLEGGLYFIRLKQGTMMKTRRLVVLK